MLTTLALAAVLYAPARPRPETALPPELVGEWRYTSIRGTTYWDASSGCYLGHGGGNSSTYVFAKDGSFKEYVYMENSPSAGWTTKMFTTKEGHATVEGGTLKLKVAKGRYKTEDNRVAKYNINRPMTEAEAKKLDRTYPFSFSDKDGKPVLTIDLGGSRMKYERVR